MTDDRYELTPTDRNGAWLRVMATDSATEQAAVLSFGGFTIHLDRVMDGPLIGSHSHESDVGDAAARDLVGLARHLNDDPAALPGCTARARVTAALR